MPVKSFKIWAQVLKSFYRGDIVAQLKIVIKVNKNEKIQRPYF
jgi:hypothetical protein